MIVPSQEPYFTTPAKSLLPLKGSNIFASSGSEDVDIFEGVFFSRLRRFLEFCIYPKKDLEVNEMI